YICFSHFLLFLCCFFFFFFFFFQAEDGIRDLTVTGVQTCALPICLLLRGASALDLLLYLRDQLGERSCVPFSTRHEGIFPARDFAALLCHRCALRFSGCLNRAGRTSGLLSRGLNRKGSLCSAHHSSADDVRNIRCFRSLCDAGALS